MRAPLTAFLMVTLTLTVTACAKSSNSSASAADQTAASATAVADSTAPSDTTSPPAPAGSAGTSSESGTPPVYPGAVLGTRPPGVGFKAPPTRVKTYSTPDDFATVKAWYRAHLKGAPEMAQPGMEKTEDAFLVGHAATAAVVLIQSFQGKTWILIGPPA
jgi:hypothetical protein